MLYNARSNVRSGWLLPRDSTFPHIISLPRLKLAEMSSAFFRVSKPATMVQNSSTSLWEAPVPYFTAGVKLGGA